MTQRVAMLSGGVGSWAAAWRARETHGPEGLTLLFTDTLIEDADAYRFLLEGAAQVLRRSSAPGLEGLLARAVLTPPSSAMDRRRPHLEALRRDAATILPGLVWLIDGRTPWDVFAQHRFLGNTRADPCSRVLKREALDRWLVANRDPAETVVYVGIDWTEEHRFTRLRDRRAATGWRYEAPLCEPPTFSKADAFELLERYGIRRPRLYDLGFSHNNCGGGCIKAGIGHFANLHRTLPGVYAEWEAGEAGLQALLGKPVTILRDRTGGTATPLSLVQLRRRLESGGQVDAFDLGGCGCFAGPLDSDESADD
jgi:hypothetical protein